MLQTIEHKGKKVFYLDLSSLGVNDVEKIGVAMGGAKKTIAAQPDKSALVITNVTNVRFNNSMAELFRDYASCNTPFVKASALVGISGMQKVVLGAIKTLTRRDYYLAKSLEDAKEWVTSQ